MITLDYETEAMASLREILEHFHSDEEIDTFKACLANLEACGLCIQEMRI